MNRKIMFFALGMTLILSAIIIPQIDFNKEEDFCKNLGIAYLTDAEMKNADELRNRGVITYSPSSDTLIGNTEVFECENIGMYLHPIEN